MVVCRVLGLVSAGLVGSNTDGRVLIAFIVGCIVRAWAVRFFSRTCIAFRLRRSRRLAICLDRR